MSLFSSTLKNALQVVWKSLGTGSVQITLAQLLQDRLNVRAFGAKCDGVTDDTAAVQAAINYLQSNGGGGLYFPAGTCLIAGTLAVTGNFIRFTGSARRAVSLKFANGAADCITVQGASTASPVNGFQMDNLSLGFSGKTGGRTLAMQYANRTVIRDIELDQCFTGFELYATNDAYLDNIIFQNVTGGASTNFNAFGPAAQKPTACYGVFWHGAADGSASAVQLTTINVTVTAAFSGADGLVWDGDASTWNMFQTTVLTARYGLWIKNSMNTSSGHVPTFLNAVNFCTDGISAIGTRIDAGQTLQFSNCCITNTSGETSQGSADTYALQINPDAAQSITRELYFSNCRIGYAMQGAALVNARDVIFSGCTFVSASTTPTNTYPGVEIGASAQDILINGSKTEIFGASNDWKYSVQVDAGSVRVNLNGNEFRGWVTKAIYWLNNDSASCDYGNSNGTTPTSVDLVPYMNPQGDAVTGAYTITASKLEGGIYTASGTPGATFTATSDTAANLVANLQSPGNGKGLELLLINATNAAMTFSPGTGVSMSGTTSAGSFTIASETARVFKLRFSNVTPGSEAVTIYG